MIDLYSVLCYHFADAMAEVDRVAADEGLKESLMRYAIESGAITEKVYHNEMEAPIEDMKRFLDGILHIYDEGRTKVSMSELFGIVTAAEEKLAEKKNSTNTGRLSSGCCPTTYSDTFRSATRAPITRFWARSAGRQNRAASNIQKHLFIVQNRFRAKPAARHRTPRNKQI